MKITLVRDDGKVKTLRTLKMELLLEQMKTEVKTQPVSKMREVLRYTLPGNSIEEVRKVPKVMPAAAFVRKEGVMTLNEYNGIVMMEVNNLSGRAEADEIKELVKELPQTYLAFTGSSGKSVKEWERFTYSDDRLPTLREQAELFHAHAYQTAVKYYQPQLPFDIELKEPSLEQYCRLTYDPELYFNPKAMPIYMKQPVSLPSETTFIKRTRETDSPLQRMAPGYENYEALSVLFSAAFNRALEELDGYREGDDLQPLLVCLAEHCFRAGIPEEDTVRWTKAHYRLPSDELLIRETVKSVYRSAKGFGKKSSLTAEQLFAMQMDEFMNRRYEFRYNTQIGEVEYRERFSFQFYFHPIDKRAQNSIMLDAQSEGIGVWDRDIDRYLHSNRVPIYNPLEEFLFHLPHWDGKDRIHALANRVPCKNPHWELLFHRWFLNMVSHWRGVDKMHANNTSPILVGRQGTHKSTFCREMIPPALRAYYTDSIDFSHKRDAELYLNRFALINIDEFDQITLPQQGFLKHILQKPVVNLRKPHGRSVLELQRYASFIGTSNQKDLLTDPSGSRRFICIEVTGNIDTTQPIDYEQLYAQAMHEIHHGERYWFDSEDEQIMTENNREFEQTPAMLQLFYQYFKTAQTKEEGEFLTPVEILNYLKKKSGMSLSDNKVYHFGRLLQKCGIPSKHTYKGTVYQVIKLS